MKKHLIIVCLCILSTVSGFAQIKVSDVLGIDLLTAKLNETSIELKKQGFAIDFTRGGMISLEPPVVFAGVNWSHTYFYFGGNKKLSLVVFVHETSPEEAQEEFNKLSQALKKKYIAYKKKSEGEDCLEFQHGKVEVSLCLKRDSAGNIAGIGLSYSIDSASTPENDL